MKSLLIYKSALSRVAMLVVLLFSIFSSAQQPAVYLAWDQETGCQEYEYIKDRSLFLESIQDGNCLRVCELATVNYEVISNLQNVDQTIWSVTGGTAVINDNVCTVTWGPSGYGYISVDVTFTDQTPPVTKEICIEKIISPTAKFEILAFKRVNIYQGCVNQEIQFENLSDDNGGSEIVSYYWDFGDNQFSTLPEPSHTWSSDGLKNVQLTVTNACGCTSIYKSQIMIRSNGFTISCPSVVCEGQISTYQTSAVNCVNSVWSAIDGTIQQPNDKPEVHVVWQDVDNDGFGYLTFDPGQCLGQECTLPGTVKIPIISSRGKIVGESVICLRQQYRYTLPQWPATTFNWSLEDLAGTGATLELTDQSNEVIITTNGLSGNITLKCEYFNTILHCGGTAVYEITISEQPSIAGPMLVCEGDTKNYTFFQQGIPTTGDWVIETPSGQQMVSGVSSHSITFSDPGTYIFSAIGTTICRSYPLKVKVVPKPVAPIDSDIAGPLEVCPGVPYAYSMINPAPGTIVGWQVLGGTIQGSSYGDEVMIVFSGAGPYSVDVWRQSKNDPFCPSDPHTIVVNSISPNIDILPDQNTPNPICGSSTGNYFSSYTDGDSYEWTINPPAAGSIIAGNGSNQISVMWNQPLPNQTTPTTINLIVYKCGLALPTVFENINVIDAPVITVTTPDLTICSGSAATFTVNPSTISGTYSWYIDGVLEVGATGTTFTKTFNNITGSNTYTISVVIANPDGCLSSASAQCDPITVNESPKANLTPSNLFVGCGAGDLNAIPHLQFNFQSGLGVLAQYALWYGSPGNSPTLQFQLQMPTNPGSISVNPALYGYGSYYMVLTDVNGCTATTNTVRIIEDCSSDECSVENPNLSIAGVLTSCNQITVDVSYNVQPLSFSWNYVGLTPNAPGTMDQINLTANTPGRYIIRYNAEYMGSDGVCLLTRYAEVLVPYKADLKYAITCEPSGYSVDLLDNSTYFSDFSITNYEFKINSVQVGNGTSTSALNNSLTANATHTLSLTITGLDDYGYPVHCTDTETIFLPPLPDASFTLPNTLVCAGEPMLFSPTNPSAGNTYEWNFGDEGKNLQENATKAYAIGDLYDVTLTVTNALGCVSISNPQTVNVQEAGLEGSIQPISTVECEGSNVTLHYDGLPAPAAFQWMQEDLPIPGATQSTFSPTTEGQYWLVATASNGCQQTIIGPAKTATVTFVKPPSAKIEGPTEVCINTPFSLSAYAGMGLNYKWFVNGVHQTSWNQPQISYIPTAIGSMNFTVEISDPNNSCISSYSQAVNVFDIPAEPTIHMDISCSDYKVILSVYPTEPTGTYVWSSGHSGPTATIYGGGGPYQVRYISPAGCESTATIDVPKNPQNYLWVFPEGCYRFCRDEQNINLIGPIFTNIFDEWRWIKNDAVNFGGVDSAVEDYSITSSGDYQLHLYNGYCEKMSEKMNVIMAEECVDCDKLKYDIVAVTPKIDIQTGECYWEVKLFVDNEYNADMFLTFTTDYTVGIFSPSTIFAAANSITPHIISLYPTGAFTGGTTISVEINTTLPEGNLCTDHLEFNVPQLCVTRKEQNLSEDSTEGFMKLIPNPATNLTAVHYSVGSSSFTNCSLNLCDMTGRPLKTIKIDAASGDVAMDISGLSAGCYIVTLKSDAQILQHQKLIVRH